MSFSFTRKGFEAMLERNFNTLIKTYVRTQQMGYDEASQRFG